MFFKTQKKIEELAGRVDALSEQINSNKMLLEKILETVNNVCKKQAALTETNATLRNELADGVASIYQNQVTERELLANVRQSQVENAEQLSLIQQNLSDKLNMYSNISVKQTEEIEKLRETAAQQFGDLQNICDNTEDEVRMLLIHSVLNNVVIE